MALKTHFSILKLVSIVFHTLVTLVAFTLLGFIFASGVYYCRVQDWAWAAVSFVILGVGTYFVINAFRFRKYRWRL